MTHAHEVAEIYYKPMQDVMTPKTLWHGSWKTIATCVENSTVWFLSACLSMSV